MTATLNWCGVVLKEPAGTFDRVVGEWRVPSLATDIEGTATVAHWTGIDGLNEKVVVQAGASSTILRNSTVGISVSWVTPWIEWYPDPMEAVPDFPVAPGDLMYANVAVTGGNTATMMLINADRAVARTVSKKMPVNAAPFTGDVAEWIVERPGWPTDQPKVSRLDPLPVFTPVDFSTTLAVSSAQSKTYYNDSPSLRVIMESGTKSILAYPEVTSLGSSIDTFFRQGPTDYMTTQ